MNSPPSRASARVIPAIPSWVVRLACVLLVYPVFAGCVDASETPSGGEFLALGDPRLSGRSGWPGAFDNSPTTYDFNGDGTDEVIAHSNDTNVYVFSLAGRVLAVIPTRYPAAWHIERVLNGVEAGILVPGEPASLVITNHAAFVSAWRFVPAESRSDHFVFKKTWENRMDACRASPGMDAKPTLADLNRDGSLEVLVQTEEIGFYALRPDGSILWKQCWGGGNAAPVAADLDGDGSTEVIVASDSGLIAVLAGASGNPLWTYNAAAAGIRPSSIPASPTVAELDGRSPKEILFIAREARSDDPLTYLDNHMAIFAVHQNTETWRSELLWMRQPSWANPMSNTRLVVRDVDDDGSPDIFGMDWNTIGHYPGNWERLGPAHAFRLTANGDDVWVREMDTWWSNQDIAVEDIDGDGRIDVLVNGPGEGGDGLWRLSAATGAAESFIAVAPWQVLRGPVLVAAGPGPALSLLVPVEPMNSVERRGAILVFDLATQARD